MKRLMASVILGILVLSLAAVAAADQKPIWVESQKVRTMDQKPIWVE